MTRTMNAALALVGAMALLVVVGMSFFVRLDSPGITGMVIGLALGVVNLVLGVWLARRSLTHGMQSALRTLLSGFLARLFILGTLVVVFAKTPAVDEVAFALSFMVLFFVFLGVELFMVEKTLGGNGSPA